MKLGLCISAAIVIAFVSVLVVVNREGEPSPPTDATRPDRLVRRDLPAHLPALHTPGRPDAEAAPLYDQAIRHFRRHEARLARPAEQRADAEAEVDALRGLMIEAADAGRIDEGFLDRYLPLAPGAEPAFGATPEWLLRILLHEADRLAADAAPGSPDADAARETALAVWVFGRRMFEHNVRLFHRQRGLKIMQHAGAMLLERARAGDAQLDAEALQQWAAALREIEDAWRPKLETILSIDPHPGDLINAAQHDEDRTFRVAATLRLGIARYTAKGSANREAVERTIDELRASDDPMIAEAAEAAAALTRERLRRLN